MDKIFLIKRKNSDYESDDAIITFRTTLEEAEEYAKKKNEIYEQSLEVVKFYQEKKWLKYHELELLTEFICEELLNVPKWKAGIKQSEITTEMREERDNLYKINTEIREKNSKKLSEIEKLSEEFADELTKKFITEKGFDSLSFKRDTEYCLSTYYVSLLTKKD